MTLPVIPAAVSKDFCLGKIGWIKRCDQYSAKTKNQVPIIGDQFSLLDLGVPACCRTPVPPR
jgi:hypothetical protein